MKKVLVIGAGGQIGTELVMELRKRFGNQQVIAADVKEECSDELKDGPYVKMDVLDKDFVTTFIKEEKSDLSQ